VSSPGGEEVFLPVWAALVSVDAFQLSLLSFVYSPFAQSSPFSLES